MVDRGVDDGGVGHGGGVGDDGGLHHTGHAVVDAATAASRGHDVRVCREQRLGGHQLEGGAGDWAEGCHGAADGGGARS